MYPKGKIIISGHTITQEYDETGTVVKRSIATNHLFQLISHEKEHRIEIVSSASKDCEELLKACCESLLQSKHTHLELLISIRQMTNIIPEYVMRIPLS